ncbi:MAG: hypothetical protein JO356_00875 [Acidobacteria bacterium]|nr:hypothetical protein [Acidobacteriota bacterium]
MQKHNSTIITLMVGLFLGSRFSRHDIGLMELMGLFLLVVLNGTEIWNGILRIVTMYAFRAHMTPQGGSAAVVSPRSIKKAMYLLALALGVLFGIAMLISDAIHRHP